MPARAATVTLHLSRHGHRAFWVLRSAMPEFMSHILVPIAIGAVALVLLFGLVNMMRGGSPNLSQKLMRMRVLLQFVAIIIIMATIWALGR
jgi:NADH:ubiquinone oxidoreductase subunit 6 (subunit J)